MPGVKCQAPIGCDVEVPETREIDRVPLCEDHARIYPELNPPIDLDIQIDRILGRASGNAQSAATTTTTLQEGEPEPVNDNDDDSSPI